MVSLSVSLFSFFCCVWLIYFSLGSWFELIPNCQEPGKVSGVGVSAALSPRNKAGAEQVSSPDQSLEFVKKVISNSTSFKYVQILNGYIDILELYGIYDTVFDMVSGLTDDIGHIFFWISPHFQPPETRSA
jgi:hypothetical protein